MTDGHIYQRDSGDDEDSGKQLGGNEVLRRHEQQRHAILHKDVTARANGEDVSVTLDIVPDEDDPYADLRASDSLGTPLAHVRVSAGFKLSKTSAQAWIDNDFRAPD